MKVIKDNLEQIRKIQTPFYLYDTALLKESLRTLQEKAGKYNYQVHYALKANSNKKILDIIRSYGVGVDCVSGNEISLALERGFEPRQVVFAGVGKTDAEIEYALQKNIFSFNCESLEELEVIAEIAQQINKTAPVAVRINPDVEANTHHYITTGIEENKFGISLPNLEKAIEVITTSQHLHLTGLHFHIGSQISDLEPFKYLCLKVNDIQHRLAFKNIYPLHLNLGGGLGVNYENPDGEQIVDFASFFALFNRFLKLYPDQTVHFELGRSLVAHSASIVTKVLYVKKGERTSFVILDAGMTDLIRPALYQAYHKIEHLTPRPGTESRNYDVVGPVCESADCFGKRVTLPEVKRGDLLAIRSTGAYGQVMASRYNLRELPKAYYL